MHRTTHALLCKRTTTRTPCDSPLISNDRDKTARFNRLEIQQGGSPAVDSFFPRQRYNALFNEPERDRFLIIPNMLNMCKIQHNGRTRRPDTYLRLDDGRIFGWEI